MPRLAKQSNSNISLPEHYTTSSWLLNRSKPPLLGIGRNDDTKLWSKENRIQLISTAPVPGLLWTSKTRTEPAVRILNLARHEIPDLTNSFYLESHLRMPGD